jgi:hypothetical protein
MTKPSILPAKPYPKFIRGVHCNEEFCDSYPTFALIEITPKLYEWILKAVKAIKSLGATYIERFDYTPDWKTSESDSPSESDLTDSPSESDLTDWDTLIKVSDDDIKWETGIKHTNVTCDTESIPLNLLKELFKVYKTPVEKLPGLKLLYPESESFREKLQVCATDDRDLPLMLEHLKHDESKALLNERLRNAPKK